MNITNTPANTDYLFVSKFRAEPTENMNIRVQVRMGGTYIAYDYWTPSDNSNHNIDIYINQYQRNGYDFNKIAKTINTLSKSLKLPIRYSNSMLAHKSELETAFENLNTIGLAK